MLLKEAKVSHGGRGPLEKASRRKVAKAKGKPDAPETSGTLTEGVEANPPSVKGISSTPATTEATKEEPKRSQRIQSARRTNQRKFGQSSRRWKRDLHLPSFSQSLHVRIWV